MPARALPLSGLRVIVTRPAHQADRLCELLEAQGAETARLPLFAIDAVGDPVEQARRLTEALAWDAWIFTSRNAVELAAQRLPGEWRGPQLFAVGAVTAAALEAAGHGGAQAPTQLASSETLLQLPGLVQADGKRVLIVTGEGGRGVLEQALRERGASVSTLALYRRRAVDYAAERIAAEIDLAQATVLTSGEALERLWQLAPEAARTRWLQHRLVVPSRRVLESAAARGFPAPLVPEPLNDEAIVRALTQWRRNDASQNDMTESPPPQDSVPATPAMPSPEAPAPPPPPARGARRRGGGATLAWLLVLVLLAALGYGGWLAWDFRESQQAWLKAQDQALQRLERLAAELESRSEQLATRQSDLARVVERNGTELAAVRGRIEQSEQVMGRLTEALQGGRQRFELASVEHLLLIANDRLLLERDVRSALLALEGADRRLAALNDPRLFKVREAIAEERAKLQALPRPDLTSASLTLSSLIDRVNSLPLRSRPISQRFESPGEPRNSDTDLVLPWYERAGNAVRRALSGLFSVRRDDNAHLLRMLPPEHEAVIYHVLVLKLESARVALLRGDGAAFREAARSATAWLQENFRPDDPGVVSALTELQRLASLELSAPAPDISRSLTLLRAQLEPAPQ